MPNDNQHIFQTKHNIDFLGSFYSQYKFNDWSITVAFYSAVHIIECAIYRQQKITFKNVEFEIRDSEELFGKIRNEHPELLPKNYSESFTHHTTRNIIVNENFQEISGWFNILYTNSRTARYKQYNWQDYQMKLIVKPALENITKWSNSKFTTDFAIVLPNK